MDLKLEVAKRKTWFYETQLRRLNLEAFREEVRPDQPGPVLDLISEVPSPEAVPGQFGRPQATTRVYRDSGQPVWTADDLARHGAFASSLIGRVGDFLNAREPLKLAERLAILVTCSAIGARPRRVFFMGFVLLRALDGAPGDPRDLGRDRRSASPSFVHSGLLFRS